jgi:threonine synthase
MLTFMCAGCGWTMAAGESETWPFRCPKALEGDDIDHVVRRADAPPFPLPEDGDANPFVRYRARLAAHALALESGIDDGAFVDLVRELDAAIARTAGTGFTATPFAPWPALAAKLGCGNGEIWVKDETANVGGSHKARHLMGLMLYLLVDARRRGPTATSGVRASEGRPPLAISSCGNAAFAAAIFGRATGWPLDVFVPSSASEAIVEQLRRLSAAIHTCARETEARGDPCQAAFRAAVADGAIPFCCQGSDNGLTIDGGRTLAWEMIAGFGQSVRRQWGASRIDAVFLQVGGGALASAVIQGFGDALAAGAIDRLPRFYTVQTVGAYPLKRAYDTLAERVLERVPLVVQQGFSPAADEERAELMMNHPEIVDEELQYARRHRSAFMRPWEKLPRSIAHGILDDETYDWAAVVEGMLKTGGWPLVVNEDRLVDANLFARELTGPQRRPHGLGRAGRPDEGGRHRPPPRLRAHRRRLLRQRPLELGIARDNRPSASDSRPSTVSGFRPRAQGPESRAESRWRQGLPDRPRPSHFPKCPADSRSRISPADLTAGSGDEQAGDLRGTHSGPCRMRGARPEPPSGRSVGGRAADRPPDPPARPAA